MKKPRVVIDCMIFLQAVLSKRSVASQVFDFLEKNLFTLFISREIIGEVIDVLSRQQLRERYTQITDENVNLFLKSVLQKAVLVKNVPSKFSYPRDPKDEKYINLAIEIEAEYLVSRDKDLLDLMSDVSVESKEFRQKSRPLKIIEPLEFLKIIGDKNIALDE